MSEDALPAGFRRGKGIFGHLLSFPQTRESRSYLKFMMPPIAETTDSAVSAPNDSNAEGEDWLLYSVRNQSSRRSGQEIMPAARQDTF